MNKHKICLPCVIKIESPLDIPQDAGQLQQVSGIHDFGQAALWGREFGVKCVYWHRKQELAYAYKGNHEPKRCLDGEIALQKT